MCYFKPIRLQFDVKLVGDQRAGFGAPFAYLPRHSLIRCVPEQVKLATLCLKIRIILKYRLSSLKTEVILNFIKKVCIIKSLIKLIRKPGYIQLTKRCAIIGQWKGFAVVKLIRSVIRRLIECVHRSLIRPIVNESSRCTLNIDLIIFF